MKSAKFEMNTADWRAWGLNFLRFVAVPTAISFLSALQGNMDLEMAYGVALGTGYTSVVDLFRKWSDGR